MAPSPPRTLGRLWLGAAGFSYADWVGPVYPIGTKSKDYLCEYAHYFRFVEINYSFYTMPSARTLQGMALRAPDLHFSLKAHQSMTHQRNATAGDFAQFQRALAPWIEGGKLITCLLQFPTSFHQTAENVQWLERLREGFPSLPLVVEFRSRDWADKSILPLLRQLEIGWCSVDEPHFESLMPPVAAVTGPVSYVRFHGRNYAHWWNPPEPWMRYDYLYTREELQDWVSRIERMMEHAEDTAVVFNNHYRGQAVENAQLLYDMLPESVRANTAMVAEPMPRVNSAHWKKLDARNAD